MSTHTWESLYFWSSFLIKLLCTLKGSGKKRNAEEILFWVIRTLDKLILWLAPIDLIDQFVQIRTPPIPHETQTNNAFGICMQYNRKFLSPHVAFEIQHWPLTSSIWLHVLLKTSAVWAQYCSGALSELEFKLILVYLSTYHIPICPRLDREKHKRFV